MPADATATKRRILEAAEALFADKGFEAVSMREVARAAGAPVALVHYHFDNKDRLYREIWTDRYRRLATTRTEGFATIDFEQERVILVRKLVDLFVTPLMDGPDARPFLKIMAHEFSDPREPERGVVSEHIDPMTRRFLSAFHQALPTLSDSDLGWGYQAMTGALMMHVVDVDRVTRLTCGAARSGDTKAALPALRAYIVGGWLALADRTPA